MRPSFPGNHISKVCSKFCLLLSFFKTHKVLFTKSLTRVLTPELCNPLDDCLELLISTNCRTYYIILRLIWELWWISAITIFSYILRVSEYNSKTVCWCIVHSVAFLEQTHIVNVLLLLVERPIKWLNFQNF